MTAGVPMKGLVSVRAGGSVRFGKLPPKVDYRTLNIFSYFKEDIPAPDPTLNVLERVTKNIGDYNIPELFPMYDNNVVGDCTVAGAAHGLTVYHGMVSQKHIPALTSVLKIYNRMTGGVDTGLYLLDVIRYWRTYGIEDSKIFAYASVHKNNHTHVKQAIKLFGGLLIGFQCQEKVIEEFDKQIPWQPGILMNAGHAVYVTGYDSSGVEVLTWGDKQKGTWAWWDMCVDEAYAILPPEAKLPSFTIGWDYDKLKADLFEVSLS